MKALVWTVFSVSVAAAATALAHISLEQAQSSTHKSRSGDAFLKDGPCGKAGSKRGSNVYTYAPGETITVNLVEFVAHPSYFRFAFDSDGDDDFQDPVSILPIDPNRGCPWNGIDTNDHCDKSDFYNTPAVLPEMDNLNPHISSSSGGQYTWQVKLPDVECDNCTLQVIQVMQDPFGHGPYDNVLDVYHQCIDLVLKRDSVPPPPTTGTTTPPSSTPPGTTPATVPPATAPPATAPPVTAPPTSPVTSPPSTPPTTTTPTTTTPSTTTPNTTTPPATTTPAPASDSGGCGVARTSQTAAWAGWSMLGVLWLAGHSIRLRRRARATVLVERR